MSAKDVKDRGLRPGPAHASEPRTMHGVMPPQVTNGPYRLCPRYDIMRSMNTNTILQRMRQDRIFWIAAGAVLLAYVLLRWQGSMWANLGYIAITLLSLLIAITVHECSHAWAADLLGDPTARMMGRVTLNPLAHLDPTGAVMMLVTTLTGFGIGWGKPVPVNPYRLKYGTRLGNGIVALAGPASNLVVASIFGLLARFLVLPNANLAILYFILDSIVFMNIIIAMFNLIPLPPLDGHSVLIGLLSLIKGEWAWKLSQWIIGLRRYGSMLLIGVIIVTQLLGLNLLGWVIGPPSSFVYNLIMG